MTASTTLDGAAGAPGAPAGEAAAGEAAAALTAPGLTGLFRIMLGLLAVAVMVLDLVFIPLHAADDEDHFAMAYASAHFRVGPVPAPDPALSTGAYVDAAIPAVIQRNSRAVRLGFKPIPGHTAWTGRQVFYPLPASAYVPLVYVPQMIAIRAVEAAGGTVETAIYAARVANGLTALALIGVALAFLPETLGLFVLVLLCLPKMLVLFASNSADPMNHAIVLLILAFFCRAWPAREPPRAWHFALAGLGLFAVAGVRPPLAALGLPLLWLAWRRGCRGGAIAIVAATAASLAWWAVMLPQVRDMRSPTTGTLAQKAVQFATLGPVMLIQSIVHRGVYYAATFVGELGYGDARRGHFYALPMVAYAAAAGMLGLGAAGLGEGRWRLAPLGRASLALAALAIVLGLFFSMSVAVTNIGVMVIEGVQGRYLVTPLLLLAVLTAGTMAPRERAVALVRRGLPLFLVFNLALMVALGIELYWRW